jgi:hypothetical protein
MLTTYCCFEFGWLMLMLAAIEFSNGVINGTKIEFIKYNKCSISLYFCSYLDRYLEILLLCWWNIYLVLIVGFDAWISKWDLWYVHGLCVQVLLVCLGCELNLSPCHLLLIFVCRFCRFCGCNSANSLVLWIVVYLSFLCILFANLLVWYWGWLVTVCI